MNVVTVNFLISLLFPVNWSYIKPWFSPFVPPVLLSSSCQRGAEGEVREKWGRSKRFRLEQEIAEKKFLNHNADIWRNIGAVKHHSKPKQKEQRDMNRLRQEWEGGWPAARRNTLLDLPKQWCLSTILLLHPGDRLKPSRWGFIWNMKRGWSFFTIPWWGWVSMVRGKRK